jgi:hypothetical protein
VESGSIFKTSFGCKHGKLVIVINSAAPGKLQQFDKPVSSSGNQTQWQILSCEEEQEQPSKVPTERAIG